MTWYFTLKLIHIVSGAVLFGTGLGIAFFMWMAHRGGDARVVAQTAHMVAIADAAFTATAVVVQLATGIVLAKVAGYSLGESWIVAALALYVFVGLCWLPVVAIQWQLRDLARAAAAKSFPLPAAYHALFRVWFWLAWPAFFGVLVIFALMVWKPALW